MKKVFTYSDIKQYVEDKGYTGNVHFVHEDYTFNGEPHIRLKIMPMDFKSKRSTRDKYDRARFEQEAQVSSYRNSIKTLTAKTSVGIKVSRFEEVAYVANATQLKAKQYRRLNAYGSLGESVKRQFRDFDHELANHPKVSYAGGVMKTHIGTINIKEDGSIRMGSYQNKNRISRETLLRLLDVLDDAPKVSEDDQKEIKKDAMVMKPNSPHVQVMMGLDDDEFRFLCNHFHFDHYQMILNGDGYGNSMDLEFKEEIRTHLIPKRTGMLDLI